MKELNSEKKIVLPKGVRFWDYSKQPPIPNWIRVIEEKKMERTDFKSFPWHPKLNWVPTIAKINQKTIDRLLKVNDFLRNSTCKIVPLPAKERSLQIFNDEKELEELIYNSSSIKNYNLFEITTSFPTFEPLISFKFPKSPFNKVIFLENRDTFLSMSKVCYALDIPPYSGVYYGQGLNFRNLVLSIPFEIQKNTIIEYFGDIDPTGLLIPFEAEKTLNANSKDYFITMAITLYNELIRIHKVKKYKFKAMETRKLNDIYLDFLDEENRRYVIELLNKNERIPQELLNLEQIYKLFSEMSIPDILFKPHNEFLDELYKKNK